MLLEPTFEKLHSLRLQGMIEALHEQMQNPECHSMAFEDRFSMLIDRQWDWKQNRALKNRLKKAGFKQNACPEDIDYLTPRGIHKAALAPLFLSNWIQDHQNCILTGPTGVGKTFLSCAIGQKACRNGWKTLYYFQPKLFREIDRATAEGTLNDFFHTLENTDLLIIDDWGLEPLKESQLKDFLEILDDRLDSRSTLLTSQFPLKTWHDTMGHPTLADAILDRLIHHCHKIELIGESMRKVQKHNKGDNKK